MSRKKGKACISLLLGMLLLLALVLSAGCREQEKAVRPSHIVVSAGPTVGTWMPLSTALAKIWEDNIEGLSVTVIEGSGAANYVGIHKGTFDLAWSHSVGAYDAMQGNPPFDARYDRFSALGVIYVTYLHASAGLDTGIPGAETGVTTWNNVRGLSVCPGQVGDVTEIMVRRILEVYGIYDEVRYRPMEMSDAFMQYIDRAIDVNCGTIQPGAASVLQLTMARRSIMLTLREEDLEKLKQYNPYYELGTIPAGTYPGQNQDVLTMVSGGILLIRDDFDEETAYQMTRLIFENVDHLATVHEVFKGLTPRRALQALCGVKLHPGAARYYREVGALN